MNAVAEHRARPQEPGTVVDVEIVARVRKQLGDAGDFGLVFVEMRLDVGVGELARERAGGLQLFLA